MFVPVIHGNVDANHARPCIPILNSVTISSMVICRDKAVPVIRTVITVLASTSALFAAGCGGVGQGAATLSDVPPSSQGPGSLSSRNSAASGHALTGLSSWSLLTSDALGRQPLEKEIGDTGSPLVVLDAESVEAVHKPLQKGLTQLRGASGKRFIVTLDIARLSQSSPLWKRAWQPAESGALPSSAPSWLIAGGPKATVYRTKYWDAAWQKLIFGVAASYVDAGFDGVALTGVDSYVAAQADRATAPVDMATLVTTLTRTLREKKPETSVIILDAPLLADRLSDNDRTAYWNAIDGVVAKNVFYSKQADGETAAKPASLELNPNVDLIASLDKADRAGKAVLDWEALIAKEQVADFEARARSRGYVPFVPLGQRGSSAPGATANPSSGPATSGDNTSKPLHPDTQKPVDPAVI